jgi:hypothetical protein
LFDDWFRRRLVRCHVVGNLMGRPPEEAEVRRLRDRLYESVNALLTELPKSVWEHHAAALTAYDDALRAALAAGGETETPPDEDAWQLTYERIDFAPIWSRADFEKRARKWLAESPPEGTKP